MSDTTTYYHAEAGDSFEVTIEHRDTPYAVLNIRDRNLVQVIAIFTPSGLNCTTDYLRELRNEIDEAVKSLECMGAIKEAE